MINEKLKDLISKIQWVLTCSIINAVLKQFTKVDFDEILKLLTGQSRNFHKASITNSAVQNNKIFQSGAYPSPLSIASLNCVQCVAIEF